MLAPTGFDRQDRKIPRSLRGRSSCEIALAAGGVRDFRSCRRVPHQSMVICLADLLFRHGGQKQRHDQPTNTHGKMEPSHRAKGHSHGTQRRLGRAIGAVAQRLSDSGLIAFLRDAKRTAATTGLRGDALRATAAADALVATLQPPSTSRPYTETQPTAKPCRLPPHPQPVR